MPRSALDAWSKPVAYGTPAQIAVFLESVARVLEAEPQRVFTDPEVRCSAERLTCVLDHRIVGSAGDR